MGTASILSAYKSSPSPTDRPAFEEHSRVTGNQVFLLDGLTTDNCVLFIAHLLSNTLSAYVPAGNQGG